ncbi:hypothetical protein [Psychrobacter sp. I-STPA10]|uniref:hypothetical protein n=1 Tax=Psychrobacter sp. I-STPA10 TaxID=2585769 RepID=UPI001E550844|nr:hypothetical protein [Psychrobacter sp. I-STPA10]
MKSKNFIIVVILDLKLCKGVKNPHINNDGKAEVLLANKTTQKDALDGNNVYALSGKSGIIVTESLYSKMKNEVEQYLTSRFGEDWVIELRPV